MRLLDVPFYLFVVGSIEVLALLFVSIAALVRLRAWGWRGYATRILNWTVFATILLACGCIANSIFMLIAYDRMYVNGDLVNDFFPFWPFTEESLNGSSYQPGKLLNGWSLLHIQGLWAVLAATTWGATILLYRAYVRERAQIGEEQDYEAGRRVIPDLS